MTTVAGSGAVGCGSGGYGGDGGAATSALLNQPSGIAVGGADLYIADTDNCRLRKVSGGNINTAAGTGTCGYGGDRGLATNAQLSRAEGVVVDGDGNVHIADTQNHRLRFIDVTNGFISTVAGTGWPEFCGDGGVAVASSCLNAPEGLGVDTDEPGPATSTSPTPRTTACGMSRQRRHIYTVAGNGRGRFLRRRGGGDCRLPQRARRRGSGLRWDVVHQRPAEQPRPRRDPGRDGVVNGGPARRSPPSPATARPPCSTGREAALNGADLYIADTENCRVRKVSGGTIEHSGGDGDMRL